MLHTRHSASETPQDTQVEIRFDYELRDPLSFYGAALIAVLVLLTLLILVLIIVSIFLLN